MQRRSRSPIRRTTRRGGSTVSPWTALRRFSAIGSREWAELERIREDGCPVEHHGAVPSTVDQRPSRRPSTMLALMDVDGPVGEPVAPVAAAYTSEDEEYTSDDPEAAEEGFYYDVAAARRQRASAASAWPPPPARGRPSREEYLARPPRSRAERWHASGGTVGRPSPAGDGGGARR